MNRSACSRPCALLLVLSLLAPPVFAAPQKPGEERSGILAVLWQALGELLPSLSDLGPGMDPAGAPGCAEQHVPAVFLGLDYAGAPH